MAEALTDVLGLDWTPAGADDAAWARRLSDVGGGTPPLSRAALRAAARWGYLTVAGGLARGRGAQGLRCLYLHGVYDDQVKRFGNLLRHLQRIGRFVTTDEAMRTLAGTRRAEGLEFHLSFDDAFDNNYRNAFPVLEELGVHAAFFVPSAIVSAPDTVAIGGPWTTGRGLPTRSMRWAELREMAAAGHEIGSHTRHHVRLSDISGDFDRLEAEVRDSKREIEDAVGHACRAFAWPFGTAADFDMKAHDAVQAAGYSLCFSAIRGRVQAGRTSLMAVPRHHFETDWPWLHVRYFALGGGESA